MKQAIIVLTVILVVLLLVAALVHFGVFERPETPPAATDAPTATESPATIPPTKPPTQPPTEPEPVLSDCPTAYLLNGVTLSARLTGEGTVVVPAEEFVAAAGLDADGSAHSSDKERLVHSENGLTLDDTTYSMTVGGVLYLPLLEVSEAYAYPVWVDEETDGTTYISPSARRFAIPEDVNVPVLMYHAVSDNMWGINELFVSPSDMEEQLAYLVDNGYDAIWFEDLAHVEDYDKPVILTFDDGYDDNYTELYPLLQKYQVKATVFVIGNAPGMNHKMTQEQIREISDSGLISIQSHAYTHDDLNAMSEETLIFELEESQKVLTRITGKQPYVLCYPTGRYNDLSLAVTARYYAFGLKMVGGLYNTSDDPFLVNRYYVSRYTDIYSFASFLSAAGT